MLSCEVWYLDNTCIDCVCQDAAEESYTYEAWYPEVVVEDAVCSVQTPLLLEQRIRRSWTHLRQSW